MRDTIIIAVTAATLAAYAAIPKPGRYIVLIDTYAVIKVDTQTGKTWASSARTRGWKLMPDSKE